MVDIAQDAAGFLWFATQDGLNRYDGKNFLIFQKNFDDITTPGYSKLGKLIATRNNKLWLITSGGKLEQLDLLTNKFLVVDKIGSRTLPPVSSFFINSHNNYWIGTEANGVITYNEQKKEYHHYTSNPSSTVRLKSNNIKQLYEDGKQTIWIVTDNGVTSVDAKGLQKTYGNNKISYSTIHHDAENTAWLGTFGKGLWRKRFFDTVFMPFTGFGAPHKLPADLVIETIYADKTGRIWIGTYGQGLYLIDEQASTVQHFISDKKNPASLPFNDVLSIKEDNSGGIWIGTDGGGVSYYDKRLNNFALFSNSNLPETISIEPARSITTDKNGIIWTGTSNAGLSSIDLKNNRYKTYRFVPYKRDASNYERIVSLRADSQDLWIGSQGNGLMIMNLDFTESKKWFYPGAKGIKNLPDHTIWCMLPQSQTSAWLGTNTAGLLLVDKNKGVLKQFLPSKNNNTIANATIRTLTQINDSIFCIGFEKKGIQFFNKRSETFYTSGNAAFQNFWKREPVLKSVLYQPPNLWIGTFGHGLLCLNLNTNTVHFIDEKNGLPNNTVYGILPDKKEGLWLSSNRGLCRFFPPPDLKNTNSANFISYTAADGLQSSEFNTGAWHKSNNGLLYFGGIKGLNFFNPENLNVPQLTNPVVITDVMVDNKPLQSDTATPFKKWVQLSYSSNSVAFNFVALNYISAGRLNYYYQMAGYDNGWINAGSRGYAAYTNLPPGTYTFFVKEGATASQNPAAITLVVAPPFWKTGWFTGLFILLLVLLLYAFYRYRINELLRLQTVRNRIATDLHDDIGSTLTNISILSTLSQQKLPLAHDASLFLQRISEEVNNSNQALDDIIWSVNTTNDTLEETLARMRRYAAELFDAGNIKYHLRLGEEVSGKRLDMEKRRDVFLLYKESLSNIYKHAHASEVWISSNVENGKLYLRIKDNGQGFDTTKTTHRNGLKNIANRIKKWKGKLDIKSSNAGTQLTMELPV